MTLDNSIDPPKLLFPHHDKTDKGGGHLYHSIQPIDCYWLLINNSSYYLDDDDDCKTNSFLAHSKYLMNDPYYNIQCKCMYFEYNEFDYIFYATGISPILFKT